MQADIYKPTISQDAIGAVSKTWEYEKTITCIARSIIRKGTGDNSTSVEINNYLNMLNSLVKLRSSDPIPSDRRIVKIRNKDEVIYLEDQDPSSDGGFEGSTIFEPRGSTPLVNFDGKVIEFETMLMRQEVQRLS